MADVREFICVTCPVGCTIEAVINEGTLVETRGEACRRGVAFVEEELTAPKRMLTTTVRVRGGEFPLVPVRSTEPLSKGLVPDVVARLREVELSAPVGEHQVVLADVLGTGVDIVTSRALARADEEIREP